jgi:hypothetical protein
MSGLVGIVGVSVSVLQYVGSGGAVSVAVSVGRAPDAVVAVVVTVVVTAVVAVVVGAGVVIVDWGAFEPPRASVTTPYAARASTTIPMAPVAISATGLRYHGVGSGPRS